MGGGETPPSKTKTGPRGSGPVFVWEEVRL
jgi:hypothetical protein